MTTVQIPAFAARRDSAPEPNLTSMYVIHRAMLADLRRLTELLSGPAPITGARAGAVRRYTACLLVEIDHHHGNEDDILWPIIENTAGQAVDLSPFTDDHEALEPVLDRCRRALTAGRPALAKALAELHDLLDEHIAEEEADLFPIISRFVPHHAYVWVEEQVAKRATLRELTFTVPWLDRYATRAEIESLLAQAGWPFRLLLAVTRGRYARLERLAFG